MNKDLVTTVSGLLAAISLAMQQYVNAHPEADAGGWMWYLGMAGAVGLGIWAYFTNKK